MAGPFFIQVELCLRVMGLRTVEKVLKFFLTEAWRQAGEI